MSLQIYVNFSGIGSSVKKSLEGIIRKKNQHCLYPDVYILVNLYCKLYFSDFSHLYIMSLREKKVENELF